MKIYVNGCSHTAGTRLSLPDKSQSYAYRLADYYSANIVNKSKPSSSNEKIYRETISDICTMSEGVLPDLVILQWSEPDRFETAFGPGGDYHNSYSYDGWLQHRPRSALWGSRRHLDIPFRKFYSHCHSSKNKEEYTRKFHKKHMSQMLGINAFLTSLGIRVIHIPYFRTNYNDTTYRMVNQECELLIALDLGLHNALRNKNYELCKLCYDPETNEIRQARRYEDFDGHFMADAHSQILEWLIEYIEGNRKTLTWNDLDDDAKIEQEVQNHYDWEFD